MVTGQRKGEGRGFKSELSFAESPARGSKHSRLNGFSISATEWLLLGISRERPPRNQFPKGTLPSYYQGSHFWRRKQLEYCLGEAPLRRQADQTHPEVLADGGRSPRKTLLQQAEPPTFAFFADSTNLRQGAPSTSLSLSRTRIKKGLLLRTTSQT